MEVLRVLVADDEAGMRLGIARALHEYRTFVPDVEAEVTFLVEQAESGEDALEKIGSRPPDILFLDHKMPGISGLEVLERVAEMRLDMLTVMITAYASIETAVLATRRGAWEFLPKPFTPDELRGTLQKTAARLLLARRARRLDEEKRQVRFEFVRVLGHELKAPLNAVTGYLEMMRGRSLGDDLAAYDEMVGRCTIRIEGMRRLIGDLLDLTRIESGQKTRRLADVDARAVARAVLESLEPQAGRCGVALALEPGDAAVVRADAAEVEMILTNLVSNAIKYNRPGGRVTVRLACAGTRLSIAVEDTGIGMTAEQRARIFEEFVRIRTGETARIEGTGLGLSIVRKVVQLYDGQIDAESEPGRGTTFTVVLETGATTGRPAEGGRAAPIPGGR
jgi:signal transduction histidine kinase